MTLLMKPRESRLGTLRRAAVMLGMVAALGGVTLRPVLADEWRHDGGYHDDRARWEHERWERERWEHEHRYAPPPVVYAPQPRVIYAAPPVVMAPPMGLNIVVPLRFR